MKKIITIVVLVIIVTVFFVFKDNPKEEDKLILYTSEEYGIEFNYPDSYFIGAENRVDGERGQYSLSLFEDTPENREFFENIPQGTEAPISIIITIFQNNLDNYTTKSFVEETNFSNFKLSDGNTTEVTIGGEIGLRYSATGLYENENVVVARKDYVYMFTVFYNSPTDEIRKGFEEILKSVQFTPDVNSGILPFKSGVTGKVLLGPTCPVQQDPPNPDCADKPFTTTVEIFSVASSNSSSFTTVKSDKDGVYKVMLPPGTYDLQAVGRNPFPSCSTTTITIESGKMHELDLSCDTGIR